MKAINIAPWIIIVLLLFIDYIWRHDPNIDKDLAALTEPPQSDYDHESFTFGDDNAVGNSNQPTCLIIYDYDTNSYDFSTIVQSNMVSSASEIIQIMNKYGWQASETNGNIFWMTRPKGQTNGFFFVGDPNDPH